MTVEFVSKWNDLDWKEERKIDLNVFKENKKSKVDGVSLALYYPV